VKFVPYLGNFVYISCYYIFLWFYLDIRLRIKVLYFLEVIPFFCGVSSWLKGVYLVNS
jgi:hypothetical protein